ncbi:MAG: molecular chaperone DjiA [Bacteroidales bacterium]|jgi:DnaJ like chaperone protein|nr:molecular chaperone DjiA [Bacteroidales bacterium]
MAIFKWIGGGIGWATGGFIGGLIGFAAGAFVDIVGSVSSKKTKNTAEGDFKMSLLVLIACVMKADGQVKKSELDTVKRHLFNIFGEQQALEALQILKELLNKDINYTQVALQIRQFMNYSSRLELLRLLYVVAEADAEIVYTEDVLIKNIARLMGVMPNDIESIRATFFSGRNYNSNKNNSYSSNYSNSRDTNWAYTVLQILPDVSNDEVKKAYRKMAMKYHPDKLNTLGEDIKKTGEKKFRAVQEAYNHIKNLRGMK